MTHSLELEEIQGMRCHMWVRESLQMRTGSQERSHMLVPYLVIVRVQSLWPFKKVGLTG